MIREKIIKTISFASRWTIGRQVSTKRTVTTMSKDWIQQKDINSMKSQPLFENCDEKILEPINYVNKQSNIKMLTDIIVAFNHWLKVDADKLREVEDILLKVYISGLVLDDIEDNTLKRKGDPSAHTVYGVGITINAANFASIIAIRKCLQIGHPMAVDILMEQLSELSVGQGLEMYWRDSMQCPTEEEYKEMIVKKTGSTFFMITKLMQLFSQNTSDFSNLLLSFGQYYQIRDDYCNLVSEVLTDKSYCEDLTEGKFSLPIIHAIRNCGHDQILRILRQRTQDEELKRFCVSELERCGSLQYTRDTLAALDAHIRSEVRRLGDNPRMERIIKSLYTWQQPVNQRQM